MKSSSRSMMTMASVLAAAPPQHHLILNLAHPLETSSEEESAILAAHNLTENDIEPAVLALARQQGAEAMHRAARLSATNRALRDHGHAQLLLFSVDDIIITTDTSNHNNDESKTGKKKRNHGMTTLDTTKNHDNSDEPTTHASAGFLLEDCMHLISHDEYFKNRPLLSEEVEAMAAFGLTEPEYRCVKGICGNIMGLQLDNAAYKRFSDQIRRSKKQNINLNQTFAKYAKARFFRSTTSKKRRSAAAPSNPTKKIKNAAAPSNPTKKRKRTAPSSEHI